MDRGYFKRRDCKRKLNFVLNFLINTNMSWNEMFILVEKVILSWPVLAIIVGVCVFLALVFYVANYHKDVLD